MPNLTTAIASEHTEAFRGAWKQSSRNIVTMATVVTAVRDQYGYKPMLAWLREEFDVSPSFADRLLRVHSNLLSTVNLTVEAIEQIAPSAMYLLAAASIDEGVKGEIVQRANAGEKITHEAVRVAVKRRNAPPTATPNPETIEPDADDPPAQLPEPPPEAAPAPPADPWLSYNASVDAIVALVRQVSEQVLALPSLDNKSAAFGQWVDPKHYRQFFNDVATTFESHKVIGWATEKQAKKLPDGQNFLYEIDAKRLGRKGVGR